MNPYDFVRLGSKAPVRESVHQHDRFKGMSGRITCTMTARTPIFTPKFQPRRGHSSTHERLSMNRNQAGMPAIPGTSLKGVIRNVAEAASNSCFTLPSRFSYERGRVEYELPSGFHTCGRSKSKRLCPACRLFGMLNRGKVFAGNVTIQDATAWPGFDLQWLTLAVLGAPKPRHKVFYSDQPKRRTPPVIGRNFTIITRMAPFFA